MQVGNFEEIAMKCISADNEMRKECEKALEQFKKENTEEFTKLILLGILSNDNNLKYKSFCCILLRNNLNLKNDFFSSNYISLDTNFRRQVRQIILTHLDIEEKEAKKAIKQAISFIAFVETNTDKEEWNEIFQSLITDSLNENPDIRRISLKKLCYIFKDLIMNSFNQGILVQCIDSILKNLSFTEESCIISGFKALKNLLKFCNINISELQNLICSIMAYSINQNNKIRKYSFQCLLKIVNTFDLIEDDFNSIGYTASINLLFEKDSKIYTLSLEIWDNFLNNVKNQGKKRGSDFIKASYPMMIDPLLNLLLTIPYEEVPEFIDKLGTVIGTMNKMVSPTSLAFVIKFVQKNFSIENDNCQVKSLIALITLLELNHDNSINQLLSKYLDLILGKFANKNSLVRLQAVKAIAKICENPFEILGVENNLDCILKGFEYSLNEKSFEIIHDSLNGIRFLSTIYSGVERKEQNFLLNFIVRELSYLYQTMKRISFSDEETKSKIKSEILDCMKHIIKNCKHFTETIEEFFKSLLEDSAKELISSLEINNLSIEVFSNYCEFLGSLIPKIRQVSKETLSIIIDIIFKGRYSQKESAKGLSKLIISICPYLAKEYKHYYKAFINIIFEVIKNGDLLSNFNFFKCARIIYESSIDSKVEAKDLRYMGKELLKLVKSAFTQANPDREKTIEIIKSLIVLLSYKIPKKFFDEFDKYFNFIINATNLNLNQQCNNEEMIRLNKLNALVLKLFSSIIKYEDKGKRHYPKTFLNEKLGFIFNFVLNIGTHSKFDKCTVENTKNLLNEILFNFSKETLSQFEGLKFHLLKAWNDETEIIKLILRCFK